MSALTQPGPMESLPAFRIRNAQGVAWKLVFLIATVGVCLVFLSLLLTTLNSTFGVVAYENAREPESLLPGRESLQEMTRDELLGLLRENLSTGMLRRLDSDKPLTERGENELREIVQERIVEPEIVRSWTLLQSFLAQDAIAAHAQAHPDHDLAFRSWLSADFLTSHQSSRPEDAGVRAALLGTIWIVLLAVVFAFPVGVLTAIYMEEYARRNIFTTLVSLNIQNLAGVPSVIYGLLGLAVFVRLMEPVTGGAFLGRPEAMTAAGRTILSGGLTLGLLILPLVIINTQEAFRSIPPGYRQACLSVGAQKWRVIMQRLLPFSFDRLLTVVILAISRAIGETTPLIVIGAATFIVADPAGVFSKFTALPVQIYFWSTRPQEEFQKIAAAAIVILLLLSFGMNIVLILLRENVRQAKRSL